jgi:hypothetical protein
MHVVGNSAARPSTTWKWAKRTWVSLSVLVLIIAIAGYDGRPNSDAEEVLLWFMLVLSFPASLLYSVAFAGVAILLHRHTQVTIPASHWSMGVAWVALFALGYLQWFVVVPRAIRKLRKLRER